MCAMPTRPPRVLLGHLEPMLRLGLNRLLTERGLEVAEESSSGGIPGAAAALAPDAIVLPLDDGATSDLGQLVRAAAPDAKLILWARDESEMHVYDAGRSVPRRVVTGTPDALLSELEHDQRRQGGE